MFHRQRLPVLLLLTGRFFWFSPRMGYKVKFGRDEGSASLRRAAVVYWRLRQQRKLYHYR